MNGRVLLVGGSDPGGGAGIQADVKAVTALGGYAATAITALTVQDTRAVYEIMPVPAGFMLRQLRAVLDDIGADCLKTGMLVSANVVDALCDELSERYSDIPLVVDPVMAAKDGQRLLDMDGCAVLKDRLIPRAAVLTPNVPEAEYLTGLSITKLAEVKVAAKSLLGLGAGAVLITGGHLAGEHVSDVLLTESEEHVFTAPRIPTRHTHGTGCTLASAIAAGIAQGLPLISAVERAKAYVLHALRHAPGLGQGQGPLGHAYPWEAVPPKKRKIPTSGG
ncbi:MAG: bifunctional hydroxymethylpyrimidine kinase/phosphomethylpyrimidine kinase [Gammaproteobacteria bacterium]